MWLTYEGLRTISSNSLGQENTREVNGRGQLVRSIDNEGNSNLYRYDSAGNLIELEDTSGNITRIEYDLVGNRTLLDDPDTGVTTYVYNAFGELTSQTDAKGNTVTMEYDLLGRLIRRTEPEGITTWNYDTSEMGIGKIAEVRGPSGFAESSSYDALGRPRETLTNIDGDVYNVAVTYDQYGRIDTSTRPGGFAIQNQYNEYGHLFQVRGFNSQEIFWRAEEINARGQLEQFALGNGIITNKFFDPDTGRIDLIQSGWGGGSDIQDLLFTFDAIGNLIIRRDMNQNGVREDFYYDDLNRLTRANVLGKSNVEVAYDQLGNITFKSDVGSYIYGTNGGGPHAVTEIMGPKGNSYTYDANGNRISSTTGTVEYSSFNKPTRITDSGITLIFEYGPDRSRYKQLIQTSEGTTALIYIGGGLYEREQSGGSTKETHYISAGGETVAIVTKESSGNETKRYLHHDHLGSLNVVTDESGGILERLSFDAWGLRRSETWDELGPGQIITSAVNRGFTGQEMLDRVFLIHMNGRVYDPVIGRFLSADPFVQAPEFSQGLNRYSYTLNNPLSFIDPCGFFLDELFDAIGDALGSIIDYFEENWRSLVTQVVTWIGNTFSPFAGGFLNGFVGTLLNGGDFGDAFVAGIKNGAKAFLSSRLKGGSFGQELSFSEPNLLPKIVAHGTVGGGLSMLQGGKFQHGFFSSTGAVFISQQINGLSEGTEGFSFIRTSVSLVVGGTLSELSGGKFANGAISSAFKRMYDDYVTNSGPIASKGKGGVGFVGGFFDKTFGGSNSVYQAYQNYISNGGEGAYFAWYQSGALAQWITSNDGNVLVIAHSYGADTAAKVVASGHSVRALRTVDPVSWFRPDFSEVNANSKVWTNYNAAGTGLNFPDFIAGIGGAWDKSVSSFSFSSDKNLNHSTICFFYCVP